MASKARRADYVCLSRKASLIAGASFSEIEGELNKQGYHYSKQAIQTPLNCLSKQSGPLVGLKEQGHKVYAKRK